MKLSAILLASAILLPYVAKAQFQGQVYKSDSSIAVYSITGEQKTLAWCGGFNKPQFSIADLNDDGAQDLVIYERGFGVRTFINTSPPKTPPHYVYAPEYELNFPPIQNYLIMKDYNGDGVPDLFQNEFDVYRGYYNASKQLCFQFYKSLYYSNDPHAVGEINAYNNPDDIPAIVDVDNDGDLDFLSFYILGSNMRLYKNMQVEKGLPKDTIDIELKDKCWGKFTQNYPLTHTLNVSCDSENEGLRLADLDEGAKKTHTGNTICLLDMKGHGDYDYLDGNLSWNNLVYLENGRYLYGGRDSMIHQDTAWQSLGHSLNMPVWPAAFNVDIDGDSLKDILVAPNGKGENYHCIVFYKNTGSASHPVFTYQSDSFLVDKTIDLGTAAYPMLFDYNKDGKPDLFIGSDGYFQPDGTYKSRLSYYLNTSTPGHPSFTLQTTNFLTLSTYQFSGAAPAVGDIDNDGKADLIIGHTNGTLSYFKNMAASDTVQPIWRLEETMLTDVNGDTITVLGSAAPFIYDLNKDGKKDLIIGQYHGALTYYENTGTTPGVINIELKNKQLGNIKVDKDIYAAYSTPFIGKIDNTGIDYMVVGSNSGELYRFDGFQSGNTSIPYAAIDTNYSFIDSSYLTMNNYDSIAAGADHWIIASGVYDGFRSAPAVADIDGDGKYELIVGDIYGGVKLYKQAKDVTVNVPTTNRESANVRVYPNPANDMLYLSWDKSFAQGPVQILLLSVTGQKLREETISSAITSGQMQIKSIEPGTYYCIIQSGTNKSVTPITIVR